MRPEKIAENGAILFADAECNKSGTTYRKTYYYTENYTDYTLLTGSPFDEQTEEKRTVTDVYMSPNVKDLYALRKIISNNSYGSEHISTVEMLQLHDLGKVGISHSGVSFNHYMTVMIWEHA